MELIVIFKVVVVFTVLQRIFELFIAKSNEKYILSKGGKIIPEKNYIFMVLLHSSWLILLVGFAYFSKINFIEPLFWISLMFFIFGQFLRITAIKTLGKRWSTRIVILPEAPAIRKGIFSFLRHPNYLGVVIELAALPLMGNMIEVAILFSLLNAIILYFRIKKEEESLIEFNNYSTIFNLKP